MKIFLISVLPKNSDYTIIYLEKFTLAADVFVSGGNIRKNRGIKLFTYKYVCSGSGSFKTGGFAVDNPFLIRSYLPDKSDHLTSVCSINKVILKKLPVYGVDDGIEGMAVKSFFNARLIAEAVKEYADRLHLDTDGVSSKELPKMLAQKAQDDKDPLGAAMARSIMITFGNRLGLMLLALRLGEPENRAAREDWSDAHWAYFAQVKDIILVGGLASGTFGEILRERVNAVFAMRGIRPYNILLYDNASQVAVLGCAGCITERSGVFVVMDFGQTGIKRSCVIKRDGEISEVKSFSTLPSQFMEWEIPDENEKLRQAKKLHSYLVNAIENTYKDAARITGSEPGNEIVISIASYTNDGVLDSKRGGYSKLCVLGTNYAELLEWELSGRLRRQISVQLIHDGTAVALNFHSRKNTVCLSVGSYFGIGFPDTKISRHLPAGNTRT